MILLRGLFLFESGTLFRVDQGCQEIGENLCLESFSISLRYLLIYKLRYEVGKVVFVVDAALDLLKVHHRVKLIVEVFAERSEDGLQNDI